MAGQQFEYGFDDIGNRRSAASGGDRWGVNLRYQNYTANSLNQYTQRTVPGQVSVLGTATNPATVTVNQQPTYRKGDYFRAELSLDNSSALWQAITNIAVLPNGTNADITTTNMGYVFVPKTPETFAYDADGNLTNDGRWSYIWDAENRLLGMTATTNIPSGARLKLDFVYDPRSRRTRKTVSTWNGSNYVAQSTNRFAYDGWNLVGELDQANSLQRSYCWGLDLSGSLQGAGGVGGLVAINIITNGQHFVAYDGNGNTAALVTSTGGTTSASFEYGPFGEVVRASGTVAKANPFRFSTKYQDGETDYLYYWYRYYSPYAGRWLSRDPAEEDGGENLYGFVDNNGINGVDFLGLWVTPAHNAIADAWLGNYIVKCCCGDIKVTEIIKNSSARVDGFVGIKGLRGIPNLNPFSANAIWRAQSGKNDYKHHLTEPDEDFAAMEQRWSAFIDGKLAEAKRLAGGASDNCKNIKTAIAAIGQAFHADSDAYSPMHRNGQEWDGLGHELILHPGRTRQHVAGESVRVWRGEDPNYPFSEQDRLNTLGDLNSRLKGTLDEVLKGCKK